MLTGDLQGVWWLPDSPGHIVPGTLTLSHESRPTLVVVGNIDPSLDLPAGIGTVFGQAREIAIVYGRTAAGKLVTMADARLGLRQMHIHDASSAVFELVAGSAYVGGHVDPVRSRFARMELFIERLVDWRDAAPFDFSLIPNAASVRRVEIGGEIPPDIAADIDGGGLLVRSTLSTSGDFRQQAAMSLSASLRVQLDHALPFADWLAAYVSPLRHLLALATDRPVEVDCLELTEAEGTESIEVVWPREMRATQPDRRLGPDELLFTAADLGDDPSTFLRRWLAACRTHAPVMNKFFATRYAKSMYEEDRFQNLAQTAEAYHRRRVGARKDQEGHEELCEALLDAAPLAHRTWLEDLLEHAGEYRLSDRIEQLVLMHPWLIGDVVPSKVHQWAGKVAAVRNLEAHQDPDPSRPSAPAETLFGLTQRLTVLLDACLLSELGFDSDRIAEMIRRASHAYRILKLNPSL